MEKNEDLDSVLFIPTSSSKDTDNVFWMQANTVPISFLWWHGGRPEVCGLSSSCGRRSPQARGPKKGRLTALSMPRGRAAPKTTYMHYHIKLDKEAPRKPGTQAQWPCPQTHDPCCANTEVWELSISVPLQAFHTCVGQSLQCFSSVLRIKSKPLGMPISLFLHLSVLPTINI